MDTKPDALQRPISSKARPWGWQRRTVLAIFLAMGLFYAVALPLVAERYSQIPLGLVFVVLAIAVTVWWPRRTAGDNSGT